MKKHFSCRTCGNLWTQEWDNEGKAVILYYCGLLPDFEFGNPDAFFCADHTDRETVERIREEQAPNTELLAAAKEMLAWWTNPEATGAFGFINRLRAAIAKAEGEGI